MNINGWEYPYETLQNWNLQRRDYSCIDGEADKLFENKQLDMAVIIHSIAEETMCYYAGFLVILEDKKKPEIVLQPKHSFQQHDIIFSSDGRLAFAVFGIWTEGWPIFIFDLVSQKFSHFMARTNNNTFYVKEVNANEFRILTDEWQMANNSDDSLKKLYGTEIKISRLEWRPFNEIDSYCEMLINQGNSMIVQQ